jgi:hypothetical protein
MQCLMKAKEKKTDFTLRYQGDAILSGQLPADR